MGVGSDVWAGSTRHGPRRASVAPEPASLASGLREQATGSRWASRAPHAPGREGRCHRGPCANFGLVAWKFKKNPFLFFFWFQTEFKLQKFVSKYTELQKL
jgi:hypothetical protein